MRNNELHIPVAMTSGGVYACFMNGGGAVGPAALPIFSRVNCFFSFFASECAAPSARPASAAQLQSQRTRSACQSGSLASFTWGTCASHRTGAVTRTLNTPLRNSAHVSRRVIVWEARRHICARCRATVGHGTPGRGKRASATPAFPDPDPELSRDPSRCCRRHFQASKASSWPTLPPMTSSPPTQSRLTVRQVEIIPP